MAHQWYVRVGTKEQGPFSSSELKQLVRQGSIIASSEVRRAPNGKWIAAIHVKGLLQSGSPKTTPRPHPGHSSVDASVEEFYKSLAKSDTRRPAQPRDSAEEEEEEEEEHGEPEGRTRPCKYCSNPVAWNAKRCPKCGGKRPYPIKTSETLVAVIVFVVIFLFCFAWLRDSDKSSSSSPSTTARPSPPTNVRLGKKNLVPRAGSQKNEAQAVKHGFTVDVRKQIFYELVQADDKAMHHIVRKNGIMPYPENLEEALRQQALIRQGMEKGRDKVSGKWKISRDALEDVGTEGLIHDWPMPPYPTD
jgi:truncated hemoglobin YjbI